MKKKKNMNLAKNFVPFFVLVGGFIVSSNCEATYIDKLKKQQQIQQQQNKENKEKIDILEKGEVPSSMEDKIMPMQKVEERSITFLKSFLVDLIKNFGQGNNKLLDPIKVMEVAGVKEDIIDELVGTGEYPREKAFEGCIEDKLEHAVRNAMEQVNQRFPKNFNLIIGNKEIQMELQVNSLAEYVTKSQKALENVLNFLYAQGLIGINENQQEGKKVDVIIQDIKDMDRLIMNGYLNNFDLEANLLFGNPQKAYTSLHRDVDLIK